jgi:transcriptional regulator with XRE-family HTH domain
MTGAQIIRAARVKAGLTQAELAERLGRDRAQIARWETGGQEPSFENLRAAVEACGFVLKLEIAEREEDQALDSELEASLLEAPPERVRGLLGRLGHST